MVDLEEIGRRHVALRLARVEVASAEQCELRDDSEGSNYAGYFCALEDEGLGKQGLEWCEPCIIRAHLDGRKRQASSRLSGATTRYLNALDK